MKEHEILLALKINKVLQKEDTIMKINKVLRNKFTVKNVVTLYSLAKCYNLATISESSLLYIERCFPMVNETQNFLHLDFSIVAKILSSSELNIHSEVEIFNAVIAWLKHNSEERSKYSKQLLLKIRLSLLSEHALNYILEKALSLYNDNEFLSVLKEVIDKKETSFQNNANRYCNQNKFNILIFGGFDTEILKPVSSTHQIDGCNFNNVKILPLMTIERKRFEAVYSKGEVYLFGGRDKCSTQIMSVEKYSHSTNTWNEVTHMFDERTGFRACSFIDKIFVFGGCFLKTDHVTSSCLQFDTKEENFSDKIWRKIAKMKETRYSPACVVFQENIVVSGGESINYDKLNTVESYDVFGNKWTSMPNMINPHYFHSLVTVKNKLFVVDDETNTCEFFDNVCKKFVAIKSSYTLNSNKAMSIGNKIVIFQNDKSSVIFYDVDKDEWSEETCEVLEDLKLFSCVKIPSY